jgi:hypothetical protein
VSQARGEGAARMPKAARSEGNHVRRGSEAGRSGEREAGRSGGGVGMGLTLIHPVTDAGQDAGDVARGGRGSRGRRGARRTRCSAGGRGVIIVPGKEVTRTSWMKWQPSAVPQGNQTVQGNHAGRGSAVGRSAEREAGRSGGGVGMGRGSRRMAGAREAGSRNGLEKRARIDDDGQGA